MMKSEGVNLIGGKLLMLDHLESSAIVEIDSFYDS